MIDTSDPRKVTARNGHANASYYLQSKRIIVVADDGCMRCVREALQELETEVRCRDA